jgi:hypothetical protein
MRNDGDNTYLHFNGTQEEFEEIKQAFHEGAMERRLSEARIDVYVMSNRGRVDGCETRDYYEEVCSVEPVENNGAGMDFIKLILPAIEAYFAEKYAGNSDAILDIAPYYAGNPFMPDDMEPPVQFGPIYRARMERGDDGGLILRRLINEIATDAEKWTAL